MIFFNRDKITPVEIDLKLVLSKMELMEEDIRKLKADVARLNFARAFLRKRETLKVAE